MDDGYGCMFVLCIHNPEYGGDKLPRQAIAPPKTANLPR